VEGVEGWVWGGGEQGKKCRRQLSRANQPSRAGARVWGGGRGVDGQGRRQIGREGGRAAEGCFEEVATHHSRSRPVDM